jgi:Nitrous oxide-stimulated promoter
VKMPVGKIIPALLVSAAPEIKAISFAHRRLAREWKTMEAMIRCYCRGHHETGDVLCPECQQLHDYAGVRLERCRFGAEKPTCANCPVHCYQKARREQIKVVMRYAGPRMLWQHPVLSLIHWLDGYRKAPEN